MGRATRDLRKEVAWRRRLREQARSGQSVRAWCRRHRVTETAFYWWRRELARRDTEDSAASFVPVHVAAEAVGDGSASIVAAEAIGDGSASIEAAASIVHGSASIEIVLTDGRRVRLAGPVEGQALAEVLDVLERRSC